MDEKKEEQEKGRGRKIDADDRGGDQSKRREEGRDKEMDIFIILKNFINGNR